MFSISLKYLLSLYYLLTHLRYSNSSMIHNIGMIFLVFILALSASLITLALVYCCKKTNLMVKITNKLRLILFYSTFLTSFMKGYITNLVSAFVAIKSVRIFIIIHKVTSWWSSNACINGRISNSTAYYVAAKDNRQ